MMGSVVFHLLVFSLFGAACGFEWSSSPGDHEVLVTCTGSDLLLPFNYSLTHGQQIVETTWIFEANGRAGEDIALLARGHFVVMPAFSGRVLRVGEAGVMVRQVGILESGNYTVIVTVEDGAHVITRYQRTVFVQVAAAPQSEDGSLHVQQTSQAVYDVTSGEWRVPLTCGRLASLGHPAVDVVWTMPSGQQLPSDKGDNGTFTLLLSNPPLPGNYSCSLPQSSMTQATLCLPPHSPLLEVATLTLNEVKAAFALLKAKQTEVMTVMENKTEALQAQITALQIENTQMRSDNTQLRHDMAILKNATHLMSGKNMAGAVAFNARLLSGFRDHQGNLQPWYVHTNLGSGFNETSGVFTAPVSGLYFFIATMGTNGVNKEINVDMFLDHHVVCEALAGIDPNQAKIMASCQTVLMMTRGQEVRLHSTSESAGYFYYSTTFSGFLLHVNDHDKDSLKPHTPARA